MIYLYGRGGGRGSRGCRTVPVRARSVDGVLPGKRGSCGRRARLSKPRQRYLAPVRLVRSRHLSVRQTRSAGQTLQRRHFRRSSISRRRGRGLRGGGG